EDGARSGRVRSHARAGEVPADAARFERPHLDGLVVSQAIAVSFDTLERARVVLRPREQLEEARRARAVLAAREEDDGAAVLDRVLGVLDALLGLIEVARQRPLDGRHEEIDPSVDSPHVTGARGVEHALERRAPGAYAP